MQHRDGCLEECQRHGGGQESQAEQGPLGLLIDHLMNVFYYVMCASVNLDPSVCSNVNPLWMLNKWVHISYPAFSSLTARNSK